MVRTYAGVNATTSRVGELFDLVVKESEQASQKKNTNYDVSINNSTFAITNSHHTRPPPISDLSFGGLETTNKTRPNTVPFEPTRTSWLAADTDQREPIVLPLEEAIFVEPVFGGNPTRRHNPSYYDYERQMREQDRQQRQSYMQDLQRQLEEQREHRLQTEIAMGGHEFERELLKHQRQRRASYSSTTRMRNEGNDFLGYAAQSAGRNRSAGQNGTGFGYSLGNASHGTDYEKYLRAAELQHKRDYALALQNQQQYNNNFGSTRGYTPTFSNQPISTPMRRERSVPNGLDLFENPGPIESAGYDPLALKYQSSSRQQIKPKKQEQEEIYDPWGKGGAGAPIRDRNGRLVADRRQLQKSWNGMIDSNVPHDSSQNRSTLGSALNQINSIQSRSDPSSYVNGNSNYPPDMLNQNRSAAAAPPPSNERDFYKEELRKQIEEQKRLRDLEKEKERLEDERDRLRMERDVERQRREIEEEKKKQQAKTERGLRRAEQAGQVQPNHVEHKRPPKRDGIRPPPIHDDGLEWWERQPQTSLLTRSNSTNSIRRGSPRKSPRAPPTPPARPSAADHRRSRGPSTPSDNRRLSTPNLSNINHNTPLESARDRSAAARNEQIMRQLSAMRERLNKEQMRVKSAIRRRDYGGDDLFDDDPERNNNNFNSTRPKQNHNRLPSPTTVGRQNGRMQHGKQISTFNDDDEDPPLVKLIKNSRTQLPLAFDPNSDNPEGVDRFMNQKSIDHRNASGY